MPNCDPMTQPRPNHDPVAVAHNRDPATHPLGGARSRRGVPRLGSEEKLRVAVTECFEQKVAEETSAVATRSTCRCTRQTSALRLYEAQEQR